jgi:uncharacterized protein YlxP (DUF503 family)
MTIGTLRLSFFIREARSLKDKRHFIQSFKEKARNKFNISIAEVDDQDSWQVAVFGVAVVGTDGRFVQSVLTNIVNFASQFSPMELTRHEMEIF